MSLKYIQENVPMVYAGVFIDMDLTSLNDEYLSESPFNWTSATISFTGAIEEIIMTQFESGLLFSCTEPAILDDCVDYTEWNSDLTLPGIWLLFGDYTLNYDSTYQEVSMGIYGSFLDWDMEAQGNLAPYAGFDINGQWVSLETIVLNSPFIINDVLIEIDTTDISGEYPINDVFTTWTTGTVTFTGNISEITLGGMEWGLFFSCTEPIMIQQDCTDYTSGSSDPNTPGIYLVDGDFVIDYDSTYQEVSLGIYGGFLDWIDIDQLGAADQTFFSVNGSQSVSIETIFSSLPYQINDIIVDVDTSSLSDEYPLADYWTSGTISFVGHIDEIIMTQLESGLLFSCTSPAEEDCECEECTCQIDADFTYVNINNYYSFVSSGTGMEYSWDFGDGNVSMDENPTHQYETPGGYNVCFTNFNLTDTCSITICKTILFMAITPEAEIITPNNDGYDDQVKLNCSHVNVYDRNGIMVAELYNQEYWAGTDNSQNTLPIGEYILRCNESDVIRKITVLR